MGTLSILKDVRILAMDFDGVHTDGFVYTNEDGVEFVRCSRRDSLGLELLKQQGIKLCVISKEKNPVVLARCNKLQVECYQGVHNSSNKKEILKEFAEREGVEQKDVIFIGDDVNDIEALTYAGVGVVVADAHEEVKKVAHIVLTRTGGNHALRELCDLILEAKGIRRTY